MFNHIIGTTPLFIPRKRVSVAVNAAFMPNPFGWSQYRQYNKGGNVFEDIGNSVTSFVKDPVGYTGDRLQDLDNDIIQPVYREVVQPVGRALEKVGKGIAEDPITFVATVAAIATQQYWAVPLITAASTAAKGGSFEDVLKATAISAATTYIGVQGTQWIQSGVVQLGVKAGIEIGATTAGVIANTAAFSASGALSAAAQGKDIGEGALMGGVQGALSFGINAGLKEIPGFIELGGTAESPNYVGRAIQNTLQTTVAGIAGAAVAGKDLTTAAANSIIKGAVGGLTDGINYVVNTVSNYFDPINVDMPQAIKDLPPEVKAIAADALTQVVASAVFTGGKTPVDLTKSFMNGATAAINKYVTSGFVDDVKNLSAKLTEFNSDPTVQEYTRAVQNRDDISSIYGSLADEVAPLFEERDAAYQKATAAYDAYKANPNAETEAAAVAANDDYATKEKALNEDARVVKLQEYAKQYEDAAATVSSLEPAYGEKYINTVGAAADPVTAKTNALISGIAEDTVENLHPDWRGDEYKMIYNLGDGVDGAINYLQEGLTSDRYVNSDDAEIAIEVARATAIDKVAQSQGYSSGAQLAQLNKGAYDKVVKAVESEYGSALPRLEEASVQEILSGQSTSNINDLLPRYDGKGILQVGVESAPYSESNLPPESVYVLPKRGAKFASEEEIATGSAWFISTDDGKGVWITPNNDGRMIYDEASNAMVEVKVGEAVEFDNLNDMDAWTMVNTFNAMDSEALVKVLPNAAESVEFVHNILETAKNTGSPAIINGTAMVLKGGTELVRAYNDMAIMLGKDPRNDNLRQTLDSMTGMITASTTQEYKDELKNIKTLMADAKGTGVIGAILEGATTYPATFAMEYIGTELVQEGVQWALGGGVGKAVQWGAKGLGYVDDMVKAYVNIASKGTYVASNVAEAAGGEAGNAYDQTYQLALKQGKTKDEAHELAMTNAFSTGLVAATINLATLGVGLDAMPSILYGGKEGKEGASKLFSSLLDGIKDGSIKVGKETVGEALEEGLTASWLEGQLYKLDPTRDVAKEIVESATLGAIAGGGVATALTGADVSGDFLANITKDTAPILRDLITGGPSTIGYAFATPGSVGGLSLDTAANQVASGGSFINDAVKTAEAVTDTNDEAIKQLYINMTGHEPTAADMAIAKSELAGGKTLNDVATKLYNDPYVQIKNLYKTVLDRAPTVDELTRGIGDLKSGATNISAMTDQVYNSTEARTGRVESLFKDILGRDGSQEEIAGRLAELEAGRGFDDMKNEFFNSEERKNNISNEALVRSLYKNVLNREADEEGLKGWVDSLNSGEATIQQVESAFKASSENMVQDTLAVLTDNGITDKLQQAEILTSMFGDAAKDNTYITALRDEGVAEAKAFDEAHTDLGEVFKQAVDLKLTDLTLDDLNKYVGEINETEALQQFRAEHAPQIAQAAYQEVYGKDYTPKDYQNNLIDSIVNNPNASFDDIVNNVLQPQQQVESIYKDVLYRDPDAEGLQNWTKLYVGDNLNYEQLKQMIESSTEAQQKNDPLYFLQNPDVKAAYNVDSQGMTEQQFAQWHYDNYGKNEGRKTPNPTWLVEAPTYSNDVTGWYQTYLGRIPEAEGQAFWQNQLNSGAMTAAEVQKAIATSAEAKSVTTSRVNDWTQDQTDQIKAAYKQAVGLDMPDLNLQNRLNQLTSGEKTIDQITSDLSTGVRHQVSQAYQDAYGHLPTAAEFETFMAPIQTGASTVEQVKTQLAQEAEQRRQAEQAAERQRQAEIAAEQARVAEINRQRQLEYERAVEAERQRIEEYNKKVTNYNNFNKFIQQVGPSATQMVEAKTPPAEPIEYFYNFEDIFANPKQSSFYKSPYESMAGAKGDFGDRYTAAHQAELASGKVKGSNDYVYNAGGAVEYTDMDDIIRILRGK